MSLFNIIRPGHQAMKKLDGIRAKIAETRKAIEADEKLPLPDSEARLNVRAAIVREQAKVGPKATAFGRFSYPRSGYVHHQLPELDWHMLIALLGAQDIEDRIMASIAARPGERALPADKRAAKVAELQAEVESLERAEEQEVLTLEAKGFAVLRRADVDARLVLEVWQAKSPPPPPVAPLAPRDKSSPIDAINADAVMSAAPANLEQ
jgi:hypothetical protein